MGGRVQDLAKGDINAKLKSEAELRAYVTKLIVQGMLMLLEEDVTVRCRAADDKVVQSAFDGACAEYSKIIQAESGAELKARLTLDSTKLEAGKLGGVVLTCSNGQIT